MHQSMVGAVDGTTLQLPRSLGLWMLKVIAIAGCVSVCIVRKSGKTRTRGAKIVKVHVGIAATPRDSKRDIAARAVERVHVRHAVMSMWSLTLRHVSYVASGVSQWVHMRSSWPCGARDAPQTKGDALDFALPATRSMEHKRRVIIAVAKHKAQHTLKLYVINVLARDVHKCFTYVPHVNHWNLRDVD